MFLEKVDKATVDAARQKYTDLLTNPNETRLAYFHLKSLEKFVEEARKVADGQKTTDMYIPIAFLRQRLGHDSNYLEIEKGVSQLNIVLLLKQDDGYMVLEPGGETTGLCPVNCKIEDEL